MLISVPIVMYGLRLFISATIVYMLLSSEMSVSITSPSFVVVHLPVLEIAKYTF